MSCSKAFEDVSMARQDAAAQLPPDVEFATGAGRQSATLRRNGGGLPKASQAADVRSAYARRPVLVEFLGIPGSGKTTLCSAVVSELCQDGFAITTREAYFDWTRQPLHKKLGAMVASGWRTWHFAAALTHYFISYCTSLRGLALMKVIYELSCMQVWLSTTLRRSPCSAVVLDEFACHRLAFRLRESPVMEMAGSQLIRLLFLFYPHCNVHWVFKIVPGEVAAQRISRRPMLNHRPPKPIETFSSARQQALLTQHMRLLQFMFDAIQSRSGGENAHVVNGAGPISAQVRETKKLMLGLLSDQRAAEYVHF